MVVVVEELRDVALDRDGGIVEVAIEKDREVFEERREVPADWLSHERDHLERPFLADDVTIDPFGDRDVEW